MRTYAPVWQGTIEWPRPEGSLHSFHYNPADLLCQLLPFTVPLTRPLPHMSLQLILKTLQKKKPNPPWMQKPPRANKWLLRSFSENQGDDKGWVGWQMAGEHRVIKVESLWVFLCSLFSEIFATKCPSVAAFCKIVWFCLSVTFFRTTPKPQPSLVD